MQITFLGAAQQVTGSQYLVETGSLRFLVECGLRQGRDDRDDINRQPLAYDAASLAFVVLTHAHLDHCGLLPRLYREGFRGPVYCTLATGDLVALILRDSARIQEEDARWEYRRWKRRGGPAEPPGPIYTLREAEACLRLLVPCDYGRQYTLPGEMRLRFRDAGHILGSATVELRWQEQGRSRRAIFSGDLGRHDRPIIRDPEVPEPGDVVIMEGTYGGREHQPWPECEALFHQRLTSALARGGHVLIPAFAVARTQDVLYTLCQYHRQGRLPAVPYYVDSPMALEATDIFRQHTEIFDPTTRAEMTDGGCPFEFPGLRYLRTMHDSLPLNDLVEPFVVISSSGMCAGGRIRHHLHHHLEHADDALIFVGYQAEETLGREIVDGAKEVTLFGQTHQVRCEVTYLEGFSAHADQPGLIAWAQQAARRAEQVFLTHGEPEPLAALAGRLRETLPGEVTVPQVGQRFEV